MARNTYFKSIQSANRVHWSQFLTNADSRSVWDARKIAAGRASDRFLTLENASSPTEINDTLLQHFFPRRPSPPPPLSLPAFMNLPPARPAEVSSALQKSTTTSAPRPSGIPYSIWKQVHKANERLLPSLFTPLLPHGYHPIAMKKAKGIVEDKPGKPDYRTPASFRIIVLLETVSKLLERLSALRLPSADRSLGLLHPNQCGSLAGLGCFDAVTTLTHEVRLLQAASFEVSTLFLDVNGGFDNVCANKLAMILTRGGVSAYLVAWIKSFLSKRHCRLLFQGAPKDFCLVCAPAEFNPASARIPESVPTSDQGRSADDHRFLLRGSSKAVHLTSWLAPAVNSAKHLPLASFYHEVSDLIEEIPILPLS